MFHDIAKADHEIIDTTVLQQRVFIRSHVAGRPQILFQQPNLIIEAMRIGVTMRASQAHCQLPALTGLDVAHCTGIVGKKSGVPRQGQFWRHDGNRTVIGQCPFNCKIETNALIETVRQAVDCANHGNVAAFPFCRQFMRQIMLRE